MVYAALQLYEWIIIGAGALVLLIGVIAFVLFRKRNVKRLPYDGRPIIAGLGGIDNIIEAKVRGSRLSVLIINPLLVNEAVLKQHGVSSLVMMSKKAVLLLGETASHVAFAIDKAKQSQT
jgi:phosphotransferase system IIB component